MPIKGLTDHAPSFPRIGELRKGAEKPKTGNRPGADLNGRFRFTSNIEGMVDIFTGEFGEEPNNILCYLPYKTTDENFPSWVEEWGAGSLKWRGDGENLVLWQKPDGTYSTEQKPQPKGGKANGKLHIIIPALKRMGYVVALTTSLNDIMELTGNLRAYETLRGDLRGIPFILSRVPRMISTPSGKGGKRARREKWLLHLETVPDYTQAQLEFAAHVALPQIVTTTPALESGELIDVEAGEIMGAGFALGYDGDHTPGGAAAVIKSLDNVLDPYIDGSDGVDDNPESPQKEGVVPSDVADVIMALHTHADKNTNAASAKQQRWMVTSLSDICEDEKMRKSIMMFIFSLKSSRDATSGQASAFIDWIGQSAENGYTSSATSKLEAAAIYREHKIKEGQLELMPAAAADVGDGENIM